MSENKGMRIIKFIKILNSLRKEKLLFPGGWIRSNIKAAWIQSNNKGLANFRFSEELSDEEIDDYLKTLDEM